MIFTSILVYGESNLTGELKENLIPLKTTEAEDDFEDLMPLKEILKDKRIVAMGEATHGTAEFFQMKHRMFKFLVEEMGYRVFAMETGFGSSKTINDYILHGDGSVAQCLETMGYWTWDTKEVADMINWMREFNKNTEYDDKIRFYGFDMQSIDESLIYVLNYLNRVGSSSMAEYNKKLRVSDNKVVQVKKGKTKEFRKDIDKIHNEIVENKDLYIKNSSIEEYNLILHHIETIYQYLDFKKVNGTKNSFNKRDYYMAENVKWILDYEKQYYGNDKIMLWAHNGHVAKDDSKFIVMGKNLKDFYKDDYYSIGFDFYQGSFVAMPFSFFKNLGSGGLANFHIDSTPEGSFAYEMMKTDIPISFLDLKKVQENKILSDFLSQKVHVNSIGAVYSGKPHNINPNNKIVLKDTFDALIFIKSTTGAIRFKPGSELLNGNRIIILTYTINTIINAGLILLLIAYKKRMTKTIITTDNKYYIFRKDKEKSIDKKGFNRLIININDYFNSIPTIKYWVFLILITTILTIISSIINSLDLSHYRILNDNILKIIIIILLIALTGIIELYITVIVPFKIVKRLSNPRSTNLQYILIASIISTLIRTIKYRYSGLLYILNVFIYFTEGVTYCYFYDLLNHRGEKPISNLYPVFIIFSILMTFFASIFKI